MKIAIFYTGMFRNFLDCVSNHKEMLLDFYDCDVYLNLWDTYGYGHVAKKYSTIENDIIKSEDIEKILDILKPKDYLFESFKSVEDDLINLSNLFSEQDFPPHPKNVLSMFYKIKKGGEMIEDSGVKYDVVIRLRTDVFFFHKIEINEDIKENTFYVNHNGGWDDSTLGDWFGYGDQNTMFKFCKMYNTLLKNWCGVSTINSPEFLLYVYLTNNKINIEKKEIYLNLKREIR
jgi:hypothetical protein